MIIPVVRPARPYVDLADLTDKKVVDRGWRQADGDESYAVQYAVNLTAEEEAAIRRRLATSSPVEEELYRLGALALVTDRTFRDTTARQLIAGANAIIATPTPTQANMRALAQEVKALATQVQALSAQNVGLIRLSQRLLDAAD